MGAENKIWFVMRSLFNTELQTKEKLDRAGIQVFIPMEDRIRLVRGRNRKVQVPVVRNLMFVHSDEKTLAPFLAADSKFQFMYRRGGRRNEPMVVPDDEMTRFMHALQVSRRPTFFRPEELDISKGARIRVIGGQLDGTVGYFMKVKGSRAKRLVVLIPETMALAVDVEPDLIELLPDRNLV